MGLNQAFVLFYCYSVKNYLYLMFPKIGGQLHYSGGSLWIKRGSKMPKDVKTFWKHVFFFQDKFKNHFSINLILSTF